MKNRILQTIREHELVKPGMHIVIGLSGGPDSLCMFDVLCRMAGEWNLHLYPVHVNHKFRPGAAEEDQAFAEEVCRQAGWPCRSFVYDCSRIAWEEGLTPEEAGRKVRYDAFEKVADAIAEGSITSDGAAVPRERIAIAVGQNADDQAETVLFRLLRGTGVDGLAGIAYKRYDEKSNTVIRPLLDTSRSEIEAYCKERQLSPRRDLTNEEPVYMRNRIRLELLPILKEYNPNMASALNRLAASASMDADFLWKEADKAYENALAESADEKVKLSLDSLAGCHPAIRIRVYHKALRQIGSGEDVTAAHLEGIEQVVKSDRPSASWNLPAGFVAEKQYDHLVFRKVTGSAESGKFKVTVRESAIGDADGTASAAAGAAAGAGIAAAAAAAVQTAVFSQQKLENAYGQGAAEKILLRTRQNGDYIRIMTGGDIHRKKLQDVLVDLKIPKSERDQVLLAAIGPEILWILPGESCRGRRSAAYRPDASEQGEPIIALEYSWQL